ncbi:MAG: methyltransferase [Corallococcus sp.]|nr:methyltransferase [Corallococcus sp.]
MELKEHERAEDLGYGNIHIIQSVNEYRFTTDAVLLANFMSDMTGRRVVDLGSGSGIISVIAATKKHALSVTGVEIQPQLVDMATRTAAGNGIDNVSFVCCRMQDAYKIIGSGFDCVVCNPPYRKCGSGERQLSQNLALCRHEIAVTLQEVVESAAKLLNSKGSFYIVHQSQRLAELCYLMKCCKIEPKEIQPVCPREGAEPNLVLVRGVMLGNVDCVLKSPLAICKADGTYTDRVAEFYGTNK